MMMEKPETPSQWTLPCLYKGEKLGVCAIAVLASGGVSKRKTVVNFLTYTIR